MIWRRFGAVVWLRWRLAVNQWRRQGAVHAALMTVGVMLIAASLLPAFGLSLIAGLMSLGAADPTRLLLVWDGVVLAFLFFWWCGLLMDMQRAESLSVKTMLHLPVSPAGAFLINYLPLFLPLALLQCGVVVLVYRRCLDMQGRLLQSREQRILDVVTGHAV